MKCTLLYILTIVLLFGCASQSKISNKVNEAENYYQKALEILNNTTHNALSEYLSNKALDYSNKAITLNPKESKYFRARGTSYFHLKNYTAAISNHEYAIKLDSTNWLAWMGLGIVQENIFNYSLAEESYHKALHFSEDPINIYYNLGLLYSKMGKSDLSIKSYDKVIILSPNYASAYTNRGQVKLVSRLYSDAAADFNHAISIDSTDKISYNNRGLCKFYLNKYRDAIIDFQKALSIRLGASFDENFDTDKYSVNNIANSYFALGDSSSACNYWSKAIQMGYKYRAEWKQEYNIDDPLELIKKHCK